MKISIIIPTYNCGQYIEKAILSVLNQSYTNKELIVIDGVSTDNTIEILKKYDNQITWVSEKDSGQAEAINKGFKMSTGEIVSWLNADDYYEPNIFEDIVSEFKKNNDIVLVYGKCKSINENNNETNINIPPKKITPKKLIKNGNYIYQPSSFYKSEIVKKNNYVDEVLNYWMEYDLYIKLLRNGKAQYLDKILSNFIIRDSQKSNERNREVMDQELIDISMKHGGGKFSKIFLSNIIKKTWR
jgi:glycosyltransferase involved in cell wall biosynthesis